MGNAQEAVEDYERNYEKSVRRIREEEDGLTTEVSYQGDTQLKCCMDGMMEGSRRSTWRD